MSRTGFLTVSLVLVTCGSAGAQTKTPSQRPLTPPKRLEQRVFIEMNGGLQASSLAFKDTRVDDPFFGERASWTANYKVKNAPSFDVGGGVRVWRNLVAAVTVSRFEDRRTAGLAGEIPHPFFFARSRSITGESPSLKHTEQAAHVRAMWLLPVNRRLQLAVFAGPSFFSIRRQLIEDIEYADSYPYDAASYEGSILRSVSQIRTGFNVGGDVAWFFAKNVGAGAGVRFAQAKSRLTSPANGGTVSLDLGGVQAAAGIRLRFGSRR